MTTDPESTTEPEVVDENSDNSSDGLEGYVGGLIIAGKTEIISGEGVSYTACDGSGKPYPADKNFLWNSSVEDVLVLGKSGQPVSGSGFKAGTSTIVLHFDGMTKFLDVKVRAKVPDVTGMSTKQAVGTIEGLNLRTSITGDRESVDNLAVVSQTPAPGTIVDADYTIILEPGDKRANLFSMSGGEKVEENKSIFSMSGGESKEKETSSVEFTTNNQSETQNQSNMSSNTSEDSEQKFVIESNQAVNNSRTDPKLWYRYFSFWFLKIKLQNVYPKDIKGKKPYLLVKVNNRPYRFYFSSVRPGFAIAANRRDSDFEVERSIPVNAIGNNTVEISCPAFPHIPTITEQIVIDPPSASEITSWKNNVSENAYSRLNQFKQRYEQALAGNPNKIHYLYNIFTSAQNYGEALVVVAESYCGLGEFQSALKLNALAIQALENNLSAHIKEYPDSSQTDFDYLIEAYQRQANICLMGLHDKKGYLENTASAFKMLFAKHDNQKNKKYYQSYPISNWGMRVAENLLTLGFKKSDAEPYFNLGMKYFRDKELLRQFKDFANSTYDCASPNCREIFINRPQQ